jgi:hypothetical protein
VLAVACRAVWSVLYTRGDRFTVHAFQKCFGDFLVARSASRSHIPAAYFGVFVPWRPDVMAAVAIRAGGSALSLHHRAALHALLILLDRMQ